MILLAILFGCAENVDYAMGIGAVYTTRCSAEMKVSGVEYQADCAPPACDPNFKDVGVSHGAVAIDPGVKVIGYAERTCIQDLQALAEAPARK